MSQKKSVARVAQRARAADKAYRTDQAKLAGKSFKTKDSFTNFVARLGYGENNQLSASYYQFDYLTRNRTQLEAAYRTAWLIGAAVDFPAEDMTRAGITIETQEWKPEQQAQMHAAFRDLQLWQKLNETISWARLFGGCIAVMMIDGQNLSKPLKMESIGRGQFKGLLVLDRWLVQPQLTDLITEMGPDIGMPKFYDVVGDARAMAGMHIHHSRVLRFDGLKLPYYQHLAENMWGESVVERIHDRLIAFDSGTMGLAQLLFKAHLRTYKIDQLRDIMSTGGPAYQALLQQLEFIRLTQTNEGLTLMDKNDEFEAHQYTFSGLGDALLQLGQQLSGALQIPLVRLFGQSPTGLNSSGESDLRTYYDNIEKKQETDLRQPITRLLDVMSRSVLGEKPPVDLSYRFNPLWTLKETEKAEVAAKDGETIGNAYKDGLISQKTAMGELKRSGQMTGRFTSITDEDIEAAEEDIPSAEELLAQAAGTQPGEEPTESETSEV